MKKVIIETTEDQAKLIVKALDIYSRIGIGQLKIIMEHDSIQSLTLKNKINVEEIVNKLNDIKNTIFKIPYSKYNRYLSIHNKKVLENVRVAYDILQVIRHEFWKENPERLSITVDSHVYFTSNSDTDKIKCKIEKDK